MLIVLLNIVFAFLLAGAGFVVLCENTVYSVFYLVFVFVNATALLLALGVNFLAMVFLIVYVGAIAVLFLFVVMMLSLKQIPWVKKNLSFGPLGFFILLLLLTLIFAVIVGDEADSFFLFNYACIEPNWSQFVLGFENIVLIGSVLFTAYAYCFLLAALALLIAMVGAIVLTLRFIPLESKRQNIFLQIARNIKTCSIN
jgi:NADH-quinone oxidoreductase subunit J